MKSLRADIKNALFALHALKTPADPGIVALIASRLVLSLLQTPNAQEKAQDREMLKTLAQNTGPWTSVIWEGVLAAVTRDAQGAPLSDEIVGEMHALYEEITALPTDVAPYNGVNVSQAEYYKAVYDVAYFGDADVKEYAMATLGKGLGESYDGHRPFFNCLSVYNMARSLVMRNGAENGYASNSCLTLCQAFMKAAVEPYRGKTMSRGVYELLDTFYEEMAEVNGLAASMQYMGGLNPVPRQVKMSARKQGHAAGGDAAPAPKAP